MTCHTAGCRSDQVPDADPQPVEASSSDSTAEDLSPRPDTSASQIEHHVQHREEHPESPVTAVAEQSSAPDNPSSSSTGNSWQTTGRQQGFSSANWRAAGIVGGALVGLILIIAVAMQTSASQPVDTPVASGDMHAERAAAIWVVQHYGVVTVKPDDGGIMRCVAADYLPEGSFVVKEINLYDQEFDENELSCLTQLSALTRLDLSRTTVSDSGLRYVGQVKSLKSLSLRGTAVTAHSIRQLQNGDQIISCTVTGSKTFDDEAVHAVVEAMPNLQMFSCASTSVSEEGMKALTTLQSLTNLTVTHNNWSEEALAQLADTLPECRITN